MARLGPRPVGHQDLAQSKLVRALGYTLGMAGPPIRSDIVDVYVLRRKPSPRARVEFLQMRRAEGAMIGSWHPVMGHSHEGETAVATGLRELAEETSYARNHGLIGFWQLELVNTYYLASHETIVMSPGFAAEVDSSIEPTLDSSHDDFRWVPYDLVDRRFLWPGQRAAITHILRDVISSDSPGSEHLKLDF
jgi:8-oxo-dGTP pyrophosphatase MutT (NUDIX family)